MATVAMVTGTKDRKMANLAISKQYRKYASDPYLSYGV